MMKKYVLATVVSLAVSGYALAQENSAPGDAPATPPAPPAITPPPMPAAVPDKAFQEMMEKRRAHMQEMQAFQEKMRQTNDPAERQRLMGEMQEKRDKMWKERGGMMPPIHPMGPRNAGPNMPMPPRHFGPRANYGQPYRGRQGMPSGHYGCSSKLEHHAKMEKSLENIENLLRGLVESLQQKK